VQSYFTEHGFPQEYPVLIVADRHVISEGWLETRMWTGVQRQGRRREEKHVPLNTPQSTPSRAAIISLGIGVGEIKTSLPATLQIGASLHHPQPPPLPPSSFQSLPHYRLVQFEPSSTYNLFCDLHHSRNRRSVELRRHSIRLVSLPPPILLGTPPACLHVIQHHLLQPLAVRLVSLYLERGHQSSLSFLARQATDLTSRRQV
jgi:hypothetical protein